MRISRAGARYAFRMLRNPTQRKHIFRWLESLKDRYFIEQKQPWLIFDAIDYLNSLPLEGKRIFEYGSGGSTLYWISRNMSGVSVEHDPKWYASVSALISPQIDYRLVQPEKSDMGGSVDIADPLMYASNDINFRGFNFRDYASQIDAFPPDYFDVVLVDGRARPACVAHSVCKVKVRGILILDNADLSYYTAKTQDYLRNYRRLSFYGVGPGTYQEWRTDVYVREQ